MLSQLWCVAVFAPFRLFLVSSGKFRSMGGKILPVGPTSRTFRRCLAVIYVILLITQREYICLSDGVLYVLQYLCMLVKIVKLPINTIYLISAAWVIIRFRLLTLEYVDDLCIKPLYKLVVPARVIHSSSNTWPEGSCGYSIRGACFN